jgi:hypothetical protein
MSTSAPYGWEWHEIRRDIFPRFTIEPDTSIIESLVRRYLYLAHTTPCTVDFLAQGAFNKVYRVHVGDDEYVIRVGLPLEAPYKVLSEVATSNLIRRYVSLFHTLIHIFPTE